MVSDLKRRNIVTHMFLGGKTLQEVGFPEQWEYSPLLRIYEKDGFDEECEGIVTRQKYVITEKELMELGR